MYTDLIFRRHVEEHAAQPVIGKRCQEVRLNTKTGAAKCRRYGVAAEGYGIVARDIFFVTGRDSVGQESDIDIGLADEQGFHDEPLEMRAPGRKVYIAIAWGFLKPVIYLRERNHDTRG